MTLRTRIAAVTAAALLAALALSAPPAFAASPDVDISPGVRRWRQRRRHVHQRLHRAVQPRHAPRRPDRLDRCSTPRPPARRGRSRRCPARIAAGGDYLVAEAAGTGGTTALPAPDATGIDRMSAASGKVALVTAATALTCGADLLHRRRRCATSSATAPRTTSRPRPHRACPTPPRTCAPPTARPTPTTTRPTSPPARRTRGTRPATARRPAADPPPTQRHGSTTSRAPHTVSPLVGQAVTSVPGVVTAVSDNGFWFQDPQPDDNPATSEGLFVFTSSAADRRGRATACWSAARSRSSARAATQRTCPPPRSTGPTVTVVGTGAALPAPVVSAPGGRVAPTVPRTDAPGDVETGAVRPGRQRAGLLRVDGGHAHPGQRRRRRSARRTRSARSRSSRPARSHPVRHRGGVLYSPTPTPTPSA